MGWAGGGAPAPDPAQQELARQQAQSMRDQQAFSKEQFDWMKQMAATQQANGDRDYTFQQGLADKAQARSDKYDALYDATTGKQIKAFSDAADQFDTSAYQDQLAGQAQTDVMGNVADAKSNFMRTAAARGLNPNSGAGLSALADIDLSGALSGASAATMARTAARQEGLQLRAQAAGLGGGLGGMASGSLGQASGFATSGLAGSGAGLGAASTAVGSYNSGISNAIGWGNSANTTYNGIADQRLKASQSSGGLGSILGGIAGAGLGAMTGGLGSSLGASLGSSLFSKKPGG